MRTNEFNVRIDGRTNLLYINNHSITTTINAIASVAISAVVIPRTSPTKYDEYLVKLP